MNPNGPMQQQRFQPPLQSGMPQQQNSIMSQMQQAAQQPMQGFRQPMQQMFQQLQPMMPQQQQNPFQYLMHPGFQQGQLGSAVHQMQMGNQGLGQSLLRNQAGLPPMQGNMKGGGGGGANLKGQPGGGMFTPQRPMMNQQQAMNSWQTNPQYMTGMGGGMPQRPMMY